jgi:hypothetical protein
MEPILVLILSKNDHSCIYKDRNGDIVDIARENEKAIDFNVGDDNRDFKRLFKQWISKFIDILNSSNDTLKFTTSDLHIKLLFDFNITENEQQKFISFIKSEGVKEVISNDLSQTIVKNIPPNSNDSGTLLLIRSIQNQCRIYLKNSDNKVITNGTSISFIPDPTLDIKIKLIFESIQRKDTTKAFKFDKEEIYIKEYLLNKPEDIFLDEQITLSDSNDYEFSYYPREKNEKIAQQQEEFTLPNDISTFLRSNEFNKQPGQKYAFYIYGEELNKDFYKQPLVSEFSSAEIKFLNENDIYSALKPLFAPKNIPKIVKPVNRKINFYTPFVPVSKGEVADFLFIQCNTKGLEFWILTSNSSTFIPFQIDENINTNFLPYTNFEPNSQMELGLNKLDQINNFEINENKFDTACKGINKIIKEYPDELNYVKCYLFIPTYFTYEIARHVEQQLSILMGYAPETVSFHSIFNRYLIQEHNPTYLDHINHFVLLEHFNDKIYLSIAEKGSAYAKASSQFAFKLNSDITESKENELLRHIDYFLKSLYLESKQCTFFIGNELAVNATFVSNFARIQPTIKLHLLAGTQINRIGEMARAYVITELINSLPGSRKREPITAPDNIPEPIIKKNPDYKKIGLAAISVFIILLLIFNFKDHNPGATDSAQAVDTKEKEQEQETEQEAVVNFIIKISDVNKSSDLRAAEIRLNKDLFTENATVYKLGKNGTPIGIVSIEDYLSEVSLLTRQMAFEVKDIVKNSDGKIIEFSIIEY